VSLYFTFYDSIINKFHTQPIISMKFLNKIRGKSMRSRFWTLWIALSCLLGIAVPRGYAEDFENLAWRELDWRAQQGYPQDIQHSLFLGPALWVGGGNGLFYFPADKADTLSIPKPLHSRAITCLAREDNKIYFGDASAWYEVDPVTLAKKTALGVGGIQAAARFQTIWYLAAPSGLWRWKPGAQPVIVPQTPTKKILQMLALPKGLFLRCAGNRLFFFNPTDQIFNPIALEFNEIKAPLSGYAQEGNQVWIATRGAGLVGYHYDLSEWRGLNAENMAPEIFSIAASSGRLWLGAYEAVLVYDVFQRKLLSVRSDIFRVQGVLAITPGPRRVLARTQQGRVFLATWSTPPEFNVRALPEDNPALTRWTAEVDGNRPISFEAFVQNTAYPDTWMPLALETTPVLQPRPDGRLFFDLSAETAGLSQGLYQIRFVCKDGQNIVSVQELSFAQKRQQQMIQIENLHFYAGMNRVTGTYSNTHIRTLTMINRPVKIQLDPEKKNFAFQIALQPHDHVFVFHMENMQGEKKDYYTYFSVQSKPSIKLQAAQPLLLRPKQPLEFKVEQQGLTQITAWNLEVFSRDEKPLAAFSGSSPLPNNILWPYAAWQSVIPDQGGFFLARLTVQTPSNAQFMSPMKPLIITPLLPEKTSASRGESLQKPLRYHSGKYTLLTGHIALIEQAVTKLRSDPNVILIIEGHADSRPFRRRNMNNTKLSSMRAKYVAEYIHRKYAIPMERLIPMGFGSKVPVGNNKKAKGRAKNRRVILQFIYK
jgi:outer membrane protein OmpA-like peptidoglycan-associated protein